MYNKLGTVLAVAVAVFPFAAVLAKMAQTESAITVIVVAAIFILFFAALLIATRITLEPEAETSTTAPRMPAPPIAWSWDGVNRQPDGEDHGAATTDAHH